MARRSFELLAILCALSACASAQSWVPASSAGGSLPSVRTKPEMIEEITPDALARLAAQRKQHDQNPPRLGAMPAVVSGPVIASQSFSAPPEPAPRDTNAENELLTQLRPVAMAWPDEALIEASGSRASARMTRQQYQAFLMDGRPTRLPYSTTEIG